MQAIPFGTLTMTSWIKVKAMMMNVTGRVICLGTSNQGLRTIIMIEVCIDENDIGPSLELVPSD
ncbi:hypothetical protein CPB85DRAFT_1326617 [Mucidula mucida]|nr:hypothetical protein CPB85DRAFT_1326617 [Mucidula mucida]